ncbi:MAG: rhomboid family intramembrane serine protease [Nitrospiria bacterium]
MLTVLALMWGLEVLNFLTGHSLSRMAAIVPRTLSGLVGIPLSPFLHFGFFHLLMNSVPFAILGGLICVQDKKLFVEVTLIVAAVSGVAVWMLARPAAHAGASGLIFGYFGFLLASGWYARDVQSVVIAFCVLVYYGGMIFGVLPLRAYVSWESHLFGFLAGIFTARLDARLT